MKAFKYHESLLVVLQMEGENYNPFGKRVYKTLSNICDGVFLQK